MKLSFLLLLWSCLLSAEEGFSASKIAMDFREKTVTLSLLDGRLMVEFWPPDIESFRADELASAEGRSDTDYTVQFRCAKTGTACNFSRLPRLFVDGREIGLRNLRRWQFGWREAEVVHTPEEQAMSGWNVVIKVPAGNQELHLELRAIDRAAIRRLHLQCGQKIEVTCDELNPFCLRLSGRVEVYATTIW